MKCNECGQQRPAQASDFPPGTMVESGMYRGVVVSEYVKEQYKKGCPYYEEGQVFFVNLSEGEMVVREPRFLHVLHGIIRITERV